MQQRLQDGQGRRFEYLRLSLTDVCNFRCSYCLPEGYRKSADVPANLTVDEIRRLVTAFATLGLWKVRLTGGEPSLRRELIDIAAAASRVPGILPPVCFSIWTRCSDSQQPVPRDQSLERS